MRSGIFVDTSAWYALANAGDRRHAVATKFLSQALSDYPELVSTNHVVGETYTLRICRAGHELACVFLRNLRRTKKLRMSFVSQETELEAYDLLERYSDHDFSFVDGTSFIAMKAQHISDCFGFDRHFAAAGFTLLPALR